MGYGQLADDRGEGDGGHCAFALFLLTTNRLRLSRLEQHLQGVRRYRILML